jgi:hypothetical protein
MLDVACAFEILLSETLMPFARLRQRVQKRSVLTALLRTGDQSYFVEKTLDEWRSEYLNDSPNVLSIFSNSCGRSVCCSRQLPLDAGL